METEKLKPFHVIKSDKRIHRSQHKKCYGLEIKRCVFFYDCTTCKKRLMSNHHPKRACYIFLRKALDDLFLGTALLFTALIVIATQPFSTRQIVYILTCGTRLLSDSYISFQFWSPLSGIQLAQ
ncbi:uncharacterized protein EV154DRAFT_483126 [Mucor mucedo]|uniref:uncharacterized protein n=1 Tax=Mucor mucedo TaxID=29922 RepID=UPI00221EE1F7|nr:uncharacterized protein EV154DRAFT_483126 [Mucor mucedo]KAI7889396.1 hypothetical protein EV154DRAFT_483126 [Mucor mucedo]